MNYNNKYVLLLYNYNNYYTNKYQNNYNLNWLSGVLELVVWCAGVYHCVALLADLVVESIEF